MKKCDWKTAFTLAETLITLGIIGVVAALTIPSLIQNYEKQVTATRVKQAYSMISQAIKLSEIDNGRAEDWAVSNSEKGLPYTEAFLNKFILPYLKAEFCGDSNSSDIIKKCGAAVSRIGKNYFLANGTAVSFVPIWAFDNKTELGILDIVIDTNGPKKPNFMGKDQFYFEYYPNNGFKPYAAPANCSRTEILNGTCQFEKESFGCKKVKNDDEDILYRHGCTLLLMMDSWQIKDDYPW